MVFMRQGCPKQRHDAIAHDLVDGPLIAMHGCHHALQDGIEELPGLFRIAVRQQFHRALEVGKQHGDLLPFAFEGTARGEDFLREVRRSVGEACRREGGPRGRRRARATPPVQTNTVPRSSMARHWPSMSSIFQILQRSIVQLELPLEGPIGQAAPLAQQCDHLIQDRDKVHPAPSLPGAL